ncbi:MAG: hypothetical protein JEZ06_15390 [Anaerolineaceae bacterium]|nr:hypothetical protein [Anaerolineaceae bacterium]
MNKQQNNKIKISIVILNLLFTQLACNLPWAPRYEDPNEVDFIPDPKYATETSESSEVIAADIPGEEIEEETSSEPAEPLNKEVPYSWEEVTLFYDPDLIIDIQASTIPAKSGDDMYEEPAPAYTQFHLLLDAGVILVVPVDAYKEAADFAGDLLLQVEQISKQKSYTDGCLPELPLVSFFNECSHQQFNSNVGFLDFQNGTGFRFVTVYGIQDIQPVSNEHLVYKFQGFTEDMKYYIIGTFRITHTDLEEMVMDIPQEIYEDATGAALNTYFQDFEDLLNDNPQNFQPALERFDAMISSIRVE